MTDRFGPSGGPLALLVHGAVANRVTLHPLARALAARGIGAWTPDLPGHGERRGERFTFASALAMISALRREAGNAPIVLAGDSLGGYLALAAAGLGAPPRGVVAGGCTFSLHGRRSLWAALTDAPLSAIEAMAGRARTAALLEAAFGRLTGDPGLAAAVAAAGLRPAARRESIGELRRFKPAVAIRAIHAPVTFVNGALDLPLVWATRRYAALAPGGRAVVVPRVGHGVFTLAPDAVAEEIARLFRVE
jgi:pimeloyl-ACP methyl ester carboxylesterase